MVPREPLGPVWSPQGESLVVWTIKYVMFAFYLWLLSLRGYMQKPKKMVLFWLFQVRHQGQEFGQVSVDWLRLLFVYRG